MKCPNCNHQHRSRQVAERCFTAINNHYGLYVISAVAAGTEVQAPDDVVKEYTQMRNYLETFND